MEELSKFDFDVKNYENPPLINNIAKSAGGMSFKV
jgi:hypothetical protein